MHTSTAPSRAHVVLPVREVTQPNTLFSPTPLQAAGLLVRSAALDLTGKRKLSRETVDGLIEDLNRAVRLLYDHRRHMEEQGAAEYFRAMAKAVGARDPQRADELIRLADAVEQAGATRLALEAGELAEGGSL